MKRSTGMQIEDVRTADPSVYDSRPWLAHYPPDVPADIPVPDESVWDVLERVSAAHGGQTALIFQHFGMTYASLRRHADRMSRALARAGVGRGDVVLALLPNTPHFMITYYATLRLGAA